jgi:tRNA threonylcarbamoyladenosine biosynthesis protein TsaE
MIEIEARSEAEQEALGARLCSALGDGGVIHLNGDLGAGKTTLVRGFLRSLGHRGAVKSPTYTLIEPYRVAGRSIYHLDLYRLADPEELDYLGIRDLLDAHSVLLVEWPERGAGALPPADIRVDIAYLSNGRRLRLTAQSERGRLSLNRFITGQTP